MSNVAMPASSAVTVVYIDDFEVCATPFKVSVTRDKSKPLRSTTNCICCPAQLLAGNCPEPCLRLQSNSIVTWRTSVRM